MKNRILLLYPYYWPHYKAGGPVQSLYNLVSYFQGDAEFYLVSRDRDIDGQLSNQPMKLNTWVTGPHGEHIFYARSITILLLYRIIKEVKPDVVFINGLFYIDTSLYGLLLGRFTQQHIIISPRGMLQPWALARRRLRKRWYLFFIKLMIGENIGWHATDEKERDDIYKNFQKNFTVSVAPNIPREISEFQSVDFPATDGKIKLVFLSLINPNKNLHLIIDEVNKNPELFSLDIYGPIMDELYWHRCLEKFRPGSSIFYHGPVAAWDVPSVLQQYHFFVLPTQGENFGHAIFDAMSSGVPIIISRTTPWTDVDKFNAGIYCDLTDKTPLTSVFEHIAAFSNESYIAMRKNSLDYAKRYVHNRQFKKEYAFLIHNNGKDESST